MTDEAKQPEGETLRLIHDELNRQRDSLSRRAEAINGRATVLIGSAAITGGVQASGVGNGWLILAVAATATAAIFGILATLPRMGDELNPKMVRTKLYYLEPEKAELFLIDHKNDVHAEDEDRLKRRARYLKIGYVALAVSIAASFLLVAGIRVTIV